MTYSATGFHFFMKESKLVVNFISFYLNTLFLMSIANL